MAELDLRYSKTARTDFRIWMMLIVGVFFTYMGFNVDPATNCDENGNCVGWVVYVGRAVGLFFCLAGIALIVGNHWRGSGVDPQTGELVWRYGKADAVTRHPVQDISRIRLDLDSENDYVHLYDQAGDLIAFIGTEVVPWPYQDWASRLIERYPHIELDIRN